MLIDTAIVGVNYATPFSFIDSIDQNACFGDCLGKIEILNIGGGKAPYVFQWSNGAGNTTAIDSLCSGTYTLTITDANGCDSTMNFNITEPTQLTSNSTYTDEGCARNDGTAATSASGGTPPYTYSWSNNQNTDSINGLTAGSYHVTITDSLGCFLIDTVIINREPAIIPNEITNNVSCFGDCDGSVQFNPSGGNTSNYTYNWAPVPPAGQGVSSASNLCPGNYKVTISGSGVCDTIVNINIIEPALLTSNIITEDEKCGSPTANCNGKACANTSGGTAPYTYSWPTGTTSGINQDTILQVCAGNYQLTITDANGCSITENFTINKSNPIVASFNAVNSSCNICDGALDVVASGGTAPYSYLWYDQALNPISGSDSILNNICSGIYYVDIIDSNGCIQRFNSNIIDNNSEAIAVSIKDASCNGTCDGEATVSFNCSDPLCSVEWYNATTAAPLGINSLMATNLCAGDYYVEVINGSGCKTSQRITVNEPTKFSISENIANVNCASACDGKIDLVVSGTSGGPFTYNWSPTPAVGQGTANISGLCAGSYSVIISNNALCDTVITYIVNAPTAITASFTTIQPNCGQSNGSISATVNGGTVAVNYNYQWFDGANNLLVGETSANINNIPAGAYRLRVKDDNNCLDFFTTILGNIDGPTIAVDSIQDASCFSNKNGSIELDVSGGTAPYTYNWLPTGQSTEDVFNLSAGHYTVLVTDAANCISTQSFEIKQFNALNASFSTKEASCGECNGEASIIMNGGISPYTYLWSNGSTVDSATNLCGGLHTVKVTDSVGCSKTFTVSINNIDAPIATIYSTPTSCANACDGTVKVSANGGTPPYTYNWMHNNSTADSLGGICAGEYAVQIIDAKGCSRLVDFKIVSPLEITVEAEIKASNCGSTPCNGSILLNAKGGQAPYSYDWGTTSSIDTNYINGLCAGLYTVKITDANGCTKTKIITLSNNGVPINSYPRTEDVGCYGRCDGSLISNLTPSTTVSFQWLDEKGNAVAPKDSDLIGAACAGDYYLQVFALANNCISYIPVSIDSPDSINLRPSIIKPISCTGACDAEVFVSTTGGELLYN